MALERIWVIAPGEADGTLYAGGDPGVLFESRDGGASSALNRGAVGAPDAAAAGSRAAAGCACTRSCTWPGEPDRLAVGDLRGRRVADRRRRRDLAAAATRASSPRYLPEDAPEDADRAVRAQHRARAGAARAPVHAVPRRRLPLRRRRASRGPTSPTGLPSDFGFPLALDPADPDSAYVIPLIADTDRVTPEGRVRVYETRDAGASWTPRGDGLPGEHAYLTILRQAFDVDRRGRRRSSCTSARRRATSSARPTPARRWFDVATHLPPVAGRQRVSGICAVTVVPTPAGESTVSSPSSASTRSHSPATPLPPSRCPRRRRRRPGSPGRRARRRATAQRWPSRPARTWRRSSAPRR